MVLGSSPSGEQQSKAYLDRHAFEFALWKLERALCCAVISSQEYSFFFVSFDISLETKDKKKTLPKLRFLSGDLTINLFIKKNK